MTSQEVKDLFYSLGAELCGIASVDRFQEAPEGYRPTDVMPACRSAISFAVRFPAGALVCTNAVPYTRVRNSITEKMDTIALEACIELDKRGILAAPVPTNEAQYDGKTGRSRSIVSQKHAAQAAGLGTIGRNTLLITPELGSMVWLGMVLTDAELAPDPMLEPVCDGCGLCVDVCPINALENPEMDQQGCWDYAFGEDPETKYWQIPCHKCRDICPYNFGIRNRAQKRACE